ncbi:MAG TPA: hypothetical protein VE465_16215 [Streptosporangiaceae bacterium]|nr:hypothetical protein [Streptosporangiaceae bacterium]
MASKVQFLPKEIGSISRWVPADAERDTLCVMGANGGMSVTPDANFTVVFGRNEEHVNVGIGGDDKYVSRRQGMITREYSCWVLSNTGKPPIRFPGGRLVTQGDQAELPVGYTPLFIVSTGREHLLEIRIVTSVRPPNIGNVQNVHGKKTSDAARNLESDEEKLVLVCLGQRYLRNDPQPQPLTWSQVAVELSELRPAERWDAKRASRIVEKVRKRLSREHGIAGLLEEDVLPPVGNALNHNLIVDLLSTATIVKSDLLMLEE